MPSPFSEALDLVLARLPAEIEDEAVREKTRGVAGRLSALLRRPLPASSGLTDAPTGVLEDADDDE